MRVGDLGVVMTVVDRGAKWVVHRGVKEGGYHGLKQAVHRAAKGWATVVPKGGLPVVCGRGGAGQAKEVVHTNWAH